MIAHAFWKWTPVSQKRLTRFLPPLMGYASISNVSYRSIHRKGAPMICVLQNKKGQEPYSNSLHDELAEIPMPQAA
jgi:hypothetical protein